MNEPEMYSFRLRAIFNLTLYVTVLFICSCGLLDKNADTSASQQSSSSTQIKDGSSASAASKHSSANKAQAKNARIKKPKLHSDAWVSEVLSSHRQLNAVKTTATGLQYIIKKRGQGRPAKSAERVRVNYELKLASTGKVIESSLKNGRPSDLQLSKVISGWREGIRLMFVGDVTEFVIPPKLAYGRKGLPPKIQANEVLVLQVELLQVHE